MGLGFLQRYQFWRIKQIHALRTAVKIDKERYGYEIELGNDLELKFDKNGKLLNIDD